MSTEGWQQTLGVITRPHRLPYPGDATPLQAGKQNCGLDLSAGHRALVVNAVQTLTLDTQRRAVLSAFTDDVRAHCAQRCDDPPHRSAAQRGIPIEP